MSPRVRVSVGIVKLSGHLSVSSRICNPARIPLLLRKPSIMQKMSLREKAG
jgi:hypothetical protein